MVAVCKLAAYMSAPYKSVKSGLFVIGMGSSEGKFVFQDLLPDLSMRCFSAILAHRLWIIWGKARGLTYGLPICFCASWVVGLVATIRFVTSMQCKHRHLPTLI